MTLLEMKRKVLGLIEELNPDSELLTEDPDIAAKINDVINQVMFELVRIKKLPGYVTFPVKKGDMIDFARIEKESKAEVYQLGLVTGILHEYRAGGTILIALEDGEAKVDFYKYPERITDKTKNSYEFELTADALEIMPYGVAGDLLKSDLSAEYGKIYSERYEHMKQELDTRYNTTGVYVEGGLDF